MGQSFHDSLTNMKMFVVLALAAMAMAEPEADPQLLYTAGVHTPVTSINNVPVVNAVPHVYTTGVHAPTVGVVGSTVYSHPTVYYGKRDAEAEPEADAYYGYYGYARPYAYVIDHMDTQLMVTTERDLLMLSQRLMLMLSMESTDTLPTDHMPIVPTDHMLTPPDGDMERDLLMLKPRLTQLSSTPVLSQLFTPSSAPHSSLP